MRSQFKGHFREDDDTIEEIWKSATFVFDANVLLNLYRYSDKVRKEFIKLLGVIAERSWLPEQCAYEFLKNRHAAIRDQITAYNKTERDIDDLVKSFTGSKGHPFISDKNLASLKSATKAIGSELGKSRKIFEKRITQDEIKEEIADIFEGRIGKAFSSKEMAAKFEEARLRFIENTPPGYMDKDKVKDASSFVDKRSNYGDYILWDQILLKSKQDEHHVIFVTDDQKEDWWLEKSGKTVGPRPELIDEFAERCERKILIYTPDRFLHFAEKHLNEKISDNTINEIRAEHDDRLKRLAKVSTHNIATTLGILGDKGKAGKQIKESGGIINYLDPRHYGVDSDKLSDAQFMEQDIRERLNFHKVMNETLESLLTSKMADNERYGIEMGNDMQKFSNKEEMLSIKHQIVENNLKISKLLHRLNELHKSI